MCLKTRLQKRVSLQNYFMHSCVIRKTCWYFQWVRELWIVDWQINEVAKSSFLVNTQKLLTFSVAHRNALCIFGSCKCAGCIPFQIKRLKRFFHSIFLNLASFLTNISCLIELYRGVCLLNKLFGVLILNCFVCLHDFSPLHIIISWFWFAYSV